MDAILAELDAFIHPDLGIGVIVIRLVIAVILGGVMGLDREYLARPAGLRTHMLVSLAAATFTVVTLELFAHSAEGEENKSDPIRVIEAVTAGVAFLAAGSIIQARGQVHGVTTGAGLWLAGAIGTAAGIGAYPIAILATVLGLVILNLLRMVEEQVPKKAAPPPVPDGK